MFKRCLCFDLDGTLIDSCQSGLERILQLARSRNLSVTPEIEHGIKSIWGTSPLKVIQTFWPQEDPHAFLTAWGNLDIAKPSRVFPGTQETLEKLSKHFNLVIVTNRGLREAMPQLEYNNLTRFFGLIITPDYNGHKKPEPEIMNPVFKKCEADLIEQKNIIFVGDTVEGDWKLAQAVDIEFYAVTLGGMDTREKFLAAGVPEDHIMDSVADLPTILLNPC